MSESLNVVVTCADRKTSAIPLKLQMRSLRARAQDKRFEVWIDRLASSKKAVPAIDLYSGNHWHVVRSMISSAATKRAGIRFWVASAGYGLVPINAAISAYSATFAPGVDSVALGTQATARWWEMLSSWTGPKRGEARSISELASRNPKSSILIAASNVYARAMADDICTAQSHLKGGQQLALISAGLRRGTSLDECRINVDGRFQQLVGGQMHSLNVRLVRYALERRNEWHSDVRQLEMIFSAAEKQLVPHQQYHREPLSDAEILRFIRAEMRKGSGTGNTTLLRALRSSGRACEQNRFRTLFRSICDQKNS